MQLPYRSFPIAPSNKLVPNQTELLRPVIQIDFQTVKGSFGYAVLIDSGADYCLFHGSIGEQLGLDVKKGKVLGFYGTSGRNQVAYFHEITFAIQGQSITTLVGFSYGIESLSVGLLGQYGFFDKFKISFDIQNKSITLD